MPLSLQNTGRQVGKVEFFETYITATANDTTDPAIGKLIDNRDGSIRAIFSQINVTNRAGTSPTTQLRLLGGLTSTPSSFEVLKDAAGNSIQTTALSIATANTTPVNGYIDTEARARTLFPPYLSIDVDLGGTTPGWTGVVSVAIVRR